MFILLVLSCKDPYLFFKEIKTENEIGYTNIYKWTKFVLFNRNNHLKYIYKQWVIVHLFLIPRLLPSFDLIFFSNNVMLNVIFIYLFYTCSKQTCLRTHTLVRNLKTYHNCLWKITLKTYKINNIKYTIKYNKIIVIG